MNTNKLLAAIRQSSHAISCHQRHVADATHALQTALTPPEPYLYLAPLVAFLLGVRYAKPCAHLVSLPYLRTYATLLLPILKE